MDLYFLYLLGVISFHAYRYFDDIFAILVDLLQSMLSESFELDFGMSVTGTFPRRCHGVVAILKRLLKKQIVVIISNFCTIIGLGRRDMMLSWRAAGSKVWRKLFNLNIIRLSAENGVKRILQKMYMFFHRAYSCFLSTYFSYHNVFPFEVSYRQAIDNQLNIAKTENSALVEGGDGTRPTTLKNRARQLVFSVSM